MDKRATQTTGTDAVVIGAGPAGLAAAHELVRCGRGVVVLEKDRQVGGIARTAVYRGFRFDLGGHRFFSKNPQVTELWREVLGADLLVRRRLSRIYYRGKFFDYPLRPVNALLGMGLGNSLAVLASYLRRKLAPVSPEKSLADWVTNRFGDRLYRMFFRSYTEKVWGIPCTEIGAQWAAQRIRGLSLRTAVLAMFSPGRGRSGGGAIKTLIDEFYYPRLGPGMMWEAFRARVEERGGSVLTSCGVAGIRHDGAAVVSVTALCGGEPREVPVTELISSMPLPELVQVLDPPPPESVLAAAGRLRFRDFLTVALVVDAAELFPDNWIYVHDPGVRVGRIQNFGNWSPEMTPDPAKSCLGLEYFCTAGDDLWAMPDEELVKLATRELAAIGLARPEMVSDGTVVRVAKAYPVYDEEYQEAVSTIREYLRRFGNLQVIGRNGMHRYNNMDHSMLTGILAARNLCGESHDLWEVNADDEYLESAQ